MTQANDQPQPASAAPVEQELGLEPERAAFEAWATDQGLALNRHRHSYAATATAWCWDAWQGGRAAERERWAERVRSMCAADLRAGPGFYGDGAWIEAYKDLASMAGVECGYLA